MLETSAGRSLQVVHLSIVLPAGTFFIMNLNVLNFFLLFYKNPDLMTEMMDLSSDVGGPGIPFLDYRTYAERIFFPGQRGAPLSQNLDLPDSRRHTVEQGLSQLNNLLNNRLFLTRVSLTLYYRALM